MNQSNTTRAKWLHLVCGAGMVICFFLPWADWQGSVINGYDLPTGKFFSVSESRFGLGNPFPELNFSFYTFFLIPVLGTIVILLVSQNKKSSWPAMIMAALTLSLFTVFFLFTKTLTDLGVGSSPFSMLKLSAWMAALFSIGLIMSSTLPAAWIKKAGWIIIGPLFAFLGFMIIEKTVWNEKFGDTGKSKADYTLSAVALLREFASNDSAANNKYREKIIEVNGSASKVELLGDSTSNIQFADSTGSYIIFSFEKDQFDHINNIKEGEAVSLKGSCSGSIHSEILGTTSISFKRSTINKTK